MRILPNVLWFGLALGVCIFAYKPLIGRLEQGEVSKVTLAAFQIEFVRSKFEKVAPKFSTPENFAPYADRIQRSAGKVSGARALWVDGENPTKNYAERQALSSLGISFDLAKSNLEARELMALSNSLNAPYDLIISDIGRRGKDGSWDPEVEDCFPRIFPGSSKKAGCRLITLVLNIYPDHPPPIIFYSDIAANYGAPPGAFAATDRFDELAALVLDAMERRQVATVENSADPAKQRIPSADGACARFARCLSDDGAE